MTTDSPQTHLPDGPRKRVGVRVAQIRAGARLEPSQQRTLAALEQVFPVCFEPVRPDNRESLDGLLSLGEPLPQDVPADMPLLALPAEAKCPGTLPGHVPERATSVALADGPWLVRPLRGRTISESAIAGELSPAHLGSTTLASVHGRPVWWQTGERPTAAQAAAQASAYPLASLGEQESLREHLRAGRFMGLLPLVHFLTRLLGSEGWRLPPLRASFVVDDPNLHRPRYGFIDYRELARHAREHGYHVGMATVPIDGWLVDRQAQSLFAENPTALSLLIHGNDHVACELGRPRTEAQALSVIAQAIRRVEAFERRFGMVVDRVVVPPHGACSEEALKAMFRLGLEAVCIGRPYPWRDDLPAPTPLAGWRPAELVAGGLAVLPRYPLSGPREDLALRALLGHPLILYGHHGDFAEGLDVLGQAASEISALGDVRWGSTGAISRASFATRVTDETLDVGMYARRIVVEVPADVRALRVFLQEPFGGTAGHRLIHAGGQAQIAFARGVGASEPLAVAGPGRVELTLVADRPLDAATVPSPRVKIWPWIRRALAEGRDRMQAAR